MKNEVVVGCIMLASQGTHWPLKVLKFKNCKFKALKVLEKSWNMFSWVWKIWGLMDSHLIELFAILL